MPGSFRSLDWARKITLSRRRFAYMVWLTTISALVLAADILVIHLRAGHASWVMVAVAILIVVLSVIYLPMRYLFALRQSLSSSLKEETIEPD